MLAYARETKVIHDISVIRKRDKTSTFAECGRTDSDMILEEFSKETLVGEVQILRNLLDALIRIFQQQTQFQHDIVVYPFVGRSLADGLDGFG